MWRKVAASRRVTQCLRAGRRVVGQRLVFGTWRHAQPWPDRRMPRDAQDAQEEGAERPKDRSAPMLQPPGPVFSHLVN